MAAQVLVGVTALASAAMAVAAWSTAGAATTDRSAPIVELATVAVYALCLLSAGIVVVVWLWRARVNTELFRPAARHRRGRGWAVGSWFCPVVNLWFPYQVVADVWTASRPDLQPGQGTDGMRPRRLVAVWWALFVGGLLVGSYGYRLVPDDLSAAAVAQTVVAVLDAAAAVAFIALVRQISGWQGGWLRHAPAGWAPAAPNPVG